MQSINYHSENISFKPRGQRKLKLWITHTLINENKKCGAINIIFCDDKYLLDLNKKYLDKSDFTDIITFDYSEEETISGDIFISIDRVANNSRKFKTSFDNELNRVIIHGVLHLCGYSDSTKTEKTLMTEKENFYLEIYYETYNIRITNKLK